MICRSSSFPRNLVNSFQRESVVPSTTDRLSSQCVSEEEETMSSTESVSQLDARLPSAGTPAVDLARRLQTLPVCTAMDILRDVTPSRMVLRGIQPISSVPERTLAGPVRTLRYLPVRHDAPRSPAGPVSLRTVDSLKPGEILVLAAGGFEGGAVFGDMMALGALSRGAAAVIADGAVRD